MAIAEINIDLSSRVTPKAGPKAGIKYPPVHLT